MVVMNDNNVIPVKVIKKRIQQFLSDCHFMKIITFYIILNLKIITILVEW